jgi:Family of unknown function (DUF6807)
MYKLFIFIFFVSFGNLIKAQKIDIDVHADAVCFMEGKDSILIYQIAEKSLNGKYKRCDYIHPLYTLDGEVLTEDFPPDHLHHRGIFWAWHQLYIGDKRIGDAWDIKDFSWEVKSVRVLEEQGNAQAIQTEVLWKPPQWKDADGNEKAVVRETTTIKVYPAEKSYRQIDFEISLIALEKNMRLGGSEDEKGYGGFSTRIRLSDDIEFTSSTGKVMPDNLPVKAGGWMDISGSIGKGGALAGLSILCHPDNPGYPNPWILRSSASMQNAVYPYPGATAVPLSQTKPTILRYRLLIHEGNNRALNISKIYSDYRK